MVLFLLLQFFSLATFLLFLYLLLDLALLVHHGVAYSFQIGWHKSLPILLLIHTNLLLLKTLDFFTAPFTFSALQIVTLHFFFFLSLLDVYSLYLEFDTTKFDNVVFLQSILLLDISIGDVSYDKINLLKSITRILQLLTRLSILLVDISRHELFLLLSGHCRQTSHFRWLNHVVIPNLLYIKKYLCALLMLFG